MAHSMYPSSDLDSLLNSGCSFSTSPSPYPCPFPDMSKDNQARLDLNKQATSYVILAASSDFVLSADSISELWNITGSVRLTLSDAQDIRSVVVSVRQIWVPNFFLFYKNCLGSRPNCHEGQRYETHYISQHYTNTVVKKTGFKLSLQFY